MFDMETQDLLGRDICLLTTKLQDMPSENCLVLTYY